MRVDEQPLLRDIERLLGHKIEVEVLEGFTPDRSIRPQPIRLRSAAPKAGPRLSSPPRAGHALLEIDRLSGGTFTAVTRKVYERLGPTSA